MEGKQPTWVDKMKQVLKIGVEHRLENHVQRGGNNPLAYMAMFAGFEEYELVIADREDNVVSVVPEAIRSVMVLGAMSLLNELGYVSDKDLYDMENVEEEELDVVLNGHSSVNEMTH